MKGNKETLKPSHVLGLSITIYIVGAILGGLAAMIITSYMGNDADAYFNIHMLSTSAINNLLAIMAESNEAIGSVYQFENMTMNIVMMLILSAIVIVISAILLKKVIRQPLSFEEKSADR